MKNNKRKIKNYNTKITRFKTNVATFYHEGFNWKVIVPTIVYNYLLEKIEEQPPFKEFKMDIAMYYLSLIISIPARKKDKIYKWGFVPLDSKLLEKIYYKYNWYFDYFIDIQILEKKNHSSTYHKCTSYRYNYSAIKIKGEECIDFTAYEINDRVGKKVQEENFNNDCAHLSKWLDENLIIDFDSLIQSLQGEFCYNKYNLSYDKFNPIKSKAYNYWYCALTLKNQCYRATRNHDSDSRLHTNLTNLPSIFRPYISYDGENIVSLDIKNSQPYFLVLLLERYNDKRIHKIIKKIFGRKSKTILEKLERIIETDAFQNEFHAIKESILAGTFYEYLGGIFQDIKPFKIECDKETGEEIEYYKARFYNPDTEFSELKVFESKRNLMKKLTLQILYTPLKKPSKEYKIFKEHFPLLCQCMEIFKTQSESEDAFKLFPKLLQHIESDCVLDVITRTLADYYPEMPLWTIHDSICTTQSWFYLMEDTVNTLFLSYSGGVIPSFKAECWTLTKDCLNAA